MIETLLIYPLTFGTDSAILFNGYRVSDNRDMRP